MLYEERLTKIVEFVNKKKSASVSEIKDLVKVSEVTVRKELEALDKKGAIRRTRGGAVSLSSLVLEYTEIEKEQLNSVQKRAIAERAYEMIQDSQTVFLDAGSTTFELARCICRGTKRGIIVVTNSFKIINELLRRPDIELVFAGGCVRNKMMSCVGSITEDIITSLCYDISFIGANAVSIDDGISTPNLFEATIKKKMVDSAKRAILLCDSSKFDSTSMAKICPLGRFELLITDDGISASFAKRSKAIGLDVVAVEAGNHE